MEELEAEDEEEEEEERRRRRLEDDSREREREGWVILLRWKQEQKTRALAPQRPEEMNKSNETHTRRG